MGTTKFDYTALLSNKTLVHADNETELKRKIAGRTTILSYHRKENDRRDDEDELIVDRYSSNKDDYVDIKLPKDVEEFLRQHTT